MSRAKLEETDAGGDRERVPECVRAPVLEVLCRSCHREADKTDRGFFREAPYTSRPVDFSLPDAGKTPEKSGEEPEIVPKLERCDACRRGSAGVPRLGRRGVLRRRRARDRHLESPGGKG
jgi:hypothetical protein